MKRPPTDEEVRRRYGQNVVVLRTFPTDTEIKKEKSYLEMVGSMFGVQEWMWKTRSGRLLAVLIVVPTALGFVKFWGNGVTVAYDFARPYIEMVRHAPLDLSDELIVFGEHPESVIGDRVWSPDRPITFIAPGVRVEPSSPEKTRSGFLEHTLWRVGRPQYLGVFTASDKFGGRWNSPGRPVLYAADDPLVALEEIGLTSKGSSGLKYPEDLGVFTLHELMVRGTFELVDLTLVAALDTKATKAFGDQWLAEERSSILVVPSTMTTSRKSYLLRLDDPRLEVSVRRSTHIKLPS
ncbi:RES family NAD+ phosphorylase [Pseudomonas brassicacearum]|uniref:RES family NAD+ phosphorylase n=1 Tax=Pseudomonas brassicacearum TaxID=930166 RepID=UPI0006404807|nr:RES family NAD+ phosphorylase [Pseudomonas brassicacearum]